MLITIAGFKGGVGKTTVSVHLAAYLNEIKPTLLIDCDPNQSATMWSEAGKFGYHHVLIDDAQKFLKTQKFPIVVADTKAREGSDEMMQLAKVSDLVILPTRISKLDVHGLVSTLRTLQHVADVRYRVLLTMTPALVTKRVNGKTEYVKNQRLQDMRNFLEAEGVPLFKTEIQSLAAFEQGPEYGCLAKDFTGSTAMKAWGLIHELGQEIIEELKI